jgi:GNAT superfamily N-acetyltransferase
MTYHQTLPNGMTITNLQPEHADQLEVMQKIVFPTLDPAQLMRAEHYRYHVTLFQEGQFVALDGDRVVGACSSIRYHFDLDDYYHTFPQLLTGGTMDAHAPDGEWLYGMDMSVHPEYRRRGLARSMYRARHQLVRELGLKGQVAGGMMRGYGAVKDQMTPQEYFEKLKAGELKDPTISAQMSVGFEALALLPDYLTDPVCDNWGVLIMLPADRDVQ